MRKLRIKSRKRSLRGSKIRREGRRGGAVVVVFMGEGGGGDGQH